MALIKRLRKSKKNANEGERPETVRTHLRNMIIIPEMIGSVAGVYNGTRAPSPAAEPSCPPRRARARLTTAAAPLLARRQELHDRRDQAGDGGALPRGVLDQLQAGRPRQARHRVDQLLPLHPAQVSGV